MKREVRAIDVSNLPDLLRIAEEVQRSNRAHVLMRESEELAIVVPARTRKSGTSDARLSDHEAFLASAGSWKDLVDTDALLRDIYESRSRSSRPVVEL